MKFTKNCLKRALRTFVQSAAAYIAVNAVLIDYSDSKETIKSALIGLGVSALAAGFSAVMNLEKGGCEK